MLIFVPVLHPDAVSLRAGRDLDARAGCAAMPSLVRALGVETSIEEAEFAALSNAGVLALLSASGSSRLVVAAEVAQAQLEDRQSEEGELEVSGLAWPQVQALFADEPAAAEAVARAQQATRSGGLAEALETPAVLELLESYDLLWFAVEELDELA